MCHRRLRQDVGAAGEGGVEIVEDRQRILGPVLLDQQVLQEELKDKNGGRGHTAVGEKLAGWRHQTASQETIHGLSWVQYV